MTTSWIGPLAFVAVGATGDKRPPLGLYFDASQFETVTDSSGAFPQLHLRLKSSVGAASVDVLVSNDAGTAAIAAGGGGVALNIDPGLVTFTFTTPFDDALYHAQVTAEDLGAASGQICGAWIVSRSASAITVGTFQVIAGVPVQMDGVGFNLRISPN